jgi:hypothetical protein
MGLVGEWCASIKPRAVQKLRAQRLAHFTQYLVDIEAEELTFAPSLGNLTLLRAWREAVMTESDRAVRSATRVHAQG